MLFVKTDELNEVVLSHTDPMDPEYGLGKTEEELRAEGYLFEFLEELPRPVKKEGFRGVTYCDGEKFWFEYKIADGVDLQAVSLRLEELRTKDLVRKNKLEAIEAENLIIASEQEAIKTLGEQRDARLFSAETELSTVMGETATILLETEGIRAKTLEVENKIVAAEEQMSEVSTKANALENKTLELEQSKATLATQVSEAHAKITNVNTEISVTKENLGVAMEKATTAEQRAEAVDVAGLERHQLAMEKVAAESARVDNVDMTVSQSVMELMMAQMSIDAQEQKISGHGIKLDEQGNIVGMTEEMMSQVLLENMLLQMDVMDLSGKVLSAEQEMVTTKAELEDTQQQLAQTQAEVAELILMVLEGGGTTT